MRIEIETSQRTWGRGLTVLAGLAGACAACSGGGGGAQVMCASAATCTAGTLTGAGAGASPDGGAGATLRSFTPPSDPGGGGILFAASGEVLALNGYAFPPVNAGDPAFVDGWDVHFTRLLVTIDNITLSQNPNIRPGDESCTESTVAKVSGPWAVDLAHGDPSYLPGKGGPGEEAAPIAALSAQNFPAGNNAKFDTNGTAYAFGFDTVAATADAMNVNLDAPGLGDYAQMIADQCTVLYVGTATFNGQSCTCPTAASASAACDPAVYGAGNGWPQVGDQVPFHLCFRSPTSYVNCQNPDNDPAAALAGEEHQRGIFFKSNASVIGQVTIHTDHPFWDSVLHDSPAHFDQFAARVAGMGANGVFPTVTLEKTAGVPFTAYTDALGHQLSWRYCLAPPTDVHDQLVGPMAFDAQSVPQTAGTNSCDGLQDYYTYSTYNQSTQGHLNSDGLCFVSRHYPSPQ
jgi:hypothetical protein